MRPALSINFLLLLCNWKNLVFSKQSNNGEIQIIYCNTNCCEFTGTKLKESPHLNCCLFGIFLGNSVSFIRNYRIQFSNEYDCKWNVNLPELLAWTHRHSTSCRSPWLAKDLLSLPPSLFLFVYSGSFFFSIKRCLESCPPIASCSFSSILVLLSSFLFFISSSQDILHDPPPPPQHWRPPPPAQYRTSTQLPAKPNGAHSYVRKRPMKALLLRQRGKLRLSSNVSLPSHPHQAVNVLATPKMFQLQAGTPWNNPVLPQVESFVTAVSGQWCNLYWHAGSGSHVTTFRAGPPVSERGNGAFVPASTWMGGWNFFGFFSHLFEFFWVWNREWYSYASLYLDGAMFFCWNLSFF